MVEEADPLRAVWREGVSFGFRWGALAGALAASLTWAALALAVVLL